MIRKLQFFSRVILLVCLPAFVLKPVVTSLVNSFENFNFDTIQKSLCDSHSGLKSHFAKQKGVKREVCQIPVLTPAFQKMILASSAVQVLAFALAFTQHSPPNPLILRI